MTTRKHRDRARKSAKPTDGFRGKEPLVGFIETVASRVSIEEVEMSVHTSNFLHNHNVRTMEVLAGKTELELLQMSHSDGKTVREIKKLLAEYGLSLREPTSPVIISESSVYDLVNARVANCLHRNKTPTVGNLTQKTERELYSVKGLAEVGVGEIKQALAEHGLSLRHEEKTIMFQTELSELELTYDMLSRLKAGGFFTLADIAKSAETEFSSQDDRIWIGMLSRDAKQTISDALAELGIEFKPNESPHISLESHPIELGMGRGISDQLWAYGDIKTVNDLTQKTAGDLLQIRNFGPVKLKIVKAKLAEHGFSLRKD